MAPQATFSQGKQYSLILHVVLLLLMIFGLPNFLHRRIDMEPQAISVDILPMAPVSNVRPQEKAQPKQVKKPVEEKRTEKKVVQETHKVVEPKQQPQETHKVEPKPQPQEKPVPIKAKDVFKMQDKKEKKVEKKPKPKVDELDSVLKSVQDSAKAEESKHPTEKTVTQPAANEAKSDHYDNSQPLSFNEKDAIRSQLQQCWHMPAGAKDAQNLIVDLRIQVGQDGSVTNVDLAKDSGRYSSDSFFRAAVDSAKRAVRECSPLKNLPPDKYGSWSDMELTFDPKDAL